MPDTVHHELETTSIVLIEDDPHVRSACKELLGSNGYRVLAAETGVAGIALVCSELPDLVVTDITLPDLDGRDIVRLLHAHMPTSHIPVIAATADRTVPEPQDAGLFAAILYKPFTIQRMLEVIEVISRDVQRMEPAVRNSPRVTRSARGAAGRREVSVAPIERDGRTG
jgi:CheY-like chemotaxis protein